MSPIVMSLWGSLITWHSTQNLLVMHKTSLREYNEGILDFYFQYLSSISTQGYFCRLVWE